MIQFLTEAAQQETMEFVEETTTKIKPLVEQLKDILEIKPSVRSLDTYLPFLGGGAKS